MPEHSNDSNCKPKKKNILLRIREHEFNVIADKTPRDPVRSAFYPQKKNQMGSEKTSPRTKSRVSHAAQTFRALFGRPLAESFSLKRLCFLPLNVFPPLHMLIEINNSGKMNQFPINNGC